jgi:hypothetical protein
MLTPSASVDANNWFFISLFPLPAQSDPAESSALIIIIPVCIFIDTAAAMYVNKFCTVGKCST